MRTQTFLTRRLVGQAIASMCLLTTGGTMSAEEQSTSVQRPSSDLGSPRAPATMGTTYLRSSAPAFLVKVPTSDASSITDDARRATADASIDQHSLKAYTNYQILRKVGVAPAAATTAPQGGETPESMRGVYGIPPGGGSGVIAIVDAFRYPQADADLATFSTKFGLPQCRENTQDESKGCLRRFPEVNGHATDGNIPVNCGWAGEAALDLEWAHAIAPKAKLIFVEANSDTRADLYAAVSIAVQAVKAAGGGQVSMSWSSLEYSTEHADDIDFPTGVLYFASSGDVGGQMGYPAASPNVISVGGTGIQRNQSGVFVREYGWSGSGGGRSAWEQLPSYQTSVINIVGTTRNVPDISADADPYTGAAVWISTPATSCNDHPNSDQYQAGWQIIGGTSLATPMVAAMANVAGGQRTSVAEELAAIYANAKTQPSTGRITDITQQDPRGPAGTNSVKVGYDNVTGVGTPKGAGFDAAPTTPVGAGHSQ